MIDYERVHMIVKDNNGQVNIDTPICVVRQLIENPALATTTLKEMFVFQKMGLICQLYLEEENDE